MINYQSCVDASKRCCMRLLAAVLLVAFGFGRAHAAEPDADCDALIDAFLTAVPGNRELHMDRLVKQGERGVPRIVAALGKCDAKGKVQLLYALRRLGPKAQHAVPAMIQLVRADPTGVVRREAVVSLGAAQDAKAVPVILQALNADRDQEVRRRCVSALAEFGPQAKEAAPTLVPLLVDKHMSTGAWFALLKIGKDAVPPLVAQLASPDRRARLLTVGTLGDIGTDARAATPDLILLLRDDDEVVRAWTAQAIGAVATKDPTTIRALRDTMDKDRPKVRLEAALAIWSLGQEVDRVAQYIAACARDKEYVIQHVALGSIGAMKRCPPVCLKAVEAVLLGDDCNEMRIKAACTLGELGRQAKSSLPALFQALKHEERDVRTAANDAIEAIEAALERP